MPTPDEVARGGNPGREPMSGCWRVALPAVGMIFALLARMVVAAFQPATLRDLLVDGDHAARTRNVNRRVYGLRWHDGEWVISLAPQRRGPVGMGGQAALDELADIDNQAYLESLGWDR